MKAARRLSDSQLKTPSIARVVAAACVPAHGAGLEPRPPVKGQEGGDSGLKWCSWKLGLSQMEESG